MKQIVFNVFLFSLGFSLPFLLSNKKDVSVAEPKFEQRIDSVYIEPGEQKTVVFIYQTVRK